MATLFIRKVTTTVENCLAYGSADKVEELVKDDINDAINYARDDRTGAVTFKTLTTTLNCPSIGKNTVVDFYELINRNQKVSRKRRNNPSRTKPALAFHLTQSFDGFVPPIIANRIGLETAQELFGDNFRVQISTHTNTENTHNHIIFTAWGEDGTKWHDCNASYRKMREVSDRICQEHGLAILEATSQYKLMQWTDENGKKHNYEPTTRKNYLIQKRNEGELYSDSVSGYRNTQSYEQKMQQMDSKHDIIRQNIQMYIPMATSYEHLLALLRENLGYEIKDKKKNGEWLSHVAFKMPTADKYIRDSSLSEEGFYEREHITEIIRQYNEGIQIVPQTKETTEDEKILARSSDYKYYCTPVQNLSEEKIAEHTSGGERRYTPRGENDSRTVKVIKNFDKELHDALYEGGFNSVAIDNIIRREQDRIRLDKYGLKKEKEIYIQTMVQEIQDRLNLLCFIERNKLFTMEQFKAYLETKKEEYRTIESTIMECEKRLDAKEHVLQLPQKLETIANRMERMKSDANYMENEYNVDQQRSVKIQQAIERYYPKANDIENTKKTIMDFRKKVGGLSKRLQLCNQEIVEAEKFLKIMTACEQIQDKGRRSIKQEKEETDNPKVKKRKKSMER